MKVQIFDGKSGKLQSADLVITGQKLQLLLESGDRYQLIKSELEVTKLEDEILVSFKDYEIHLSPQEFHQLSLGSHHFNNNYYHLLKLMLIAFVSISLIAYFHKPFVRWTIQHIPDSWLEKITADIGRELQEKDCLSREQKDGLRKIFTRLDKHYESYRVYMIKNPEINAFALPGKIIVINDGLLQKINSSEALAGVIAHELAHIELEHSKEALVRETIIKSIASISSEKFSTFFLSHLGSSLGSQQNEKEADELAAEVLRKNRISSVGIKSFFTEQDSTGLSLSFLSTHPPYPERIKIFEADYPFKPVLSDSSWSLLQEGCTAKRRSLTF